MKWEELPLADRAQLMAAAVRNGYTDIRSIKAAYANFQNQRQQTGNRYDDGGELEVINPLDNVPVDDQEERYQYFRSTLPENLQDDTVYRLRRAWELNGEPRAFSDAIAGDNPMFSYNIDDELYHGNSVAYNPNTDEYEFLKPVDHDTVDLELMQYFNNPELEQLRQNYQMDWDEDGSRGYYKYVPRTDENALAYGGNLFKTGGNKGKKKGITQQELQRRKDYYRQQLIIRGLRGAQLEAVLANMEVESKFDPGAHNDASGARGLMQWLGSRKPKSWSEKDQLDYIAATYNKFGGNEWLDKKAWKRFNETTDPTEAARLFRRYWERPERSSWNATDKLFNNNKGSYLPQEVNDLVAQVSNLQYDEPKAPVFTEEDQRLLDTPALAFYNPKYEDTQAPDYKPSALQESIKLDESLWNNPANNWALYNQFANMQQGSSQNDPLGWMTMMASLSPNTTPQQKEAASTMYQLFAPQDGDYSYHGLNFAAYGGKVNRFDDGGRTITIGELPEAYVRAHGNMPVVTPTGNRTTLSDAYKNYNQTPVNIDDVPGITDYLVTQDQPDISEQAHIDKIAADRFVHQLGEERDKALIGLAAAITGGGALASGLALAPVATISSTIGSIAGEKAFNAGYEKLTGNNWGQDVERWTKGYIPAEYGEYLNPGTLIGGITGDVASKVGKKILNTASLSKAMNKSIGIIPDDVYINRLNSVPLITKENAKLIPDYIWDDAYFKAINAKDIVEAQRLRDLHFASKANYTPVTIDSQGNPITWYTGSEFGNHSVFDSSKMNATIGGSSIRGEKGNFTTTDLPAAEHYAGINRFSDRNVQEYTTPETIKEKVLDFFGLYKPKFIHPVDRIPKEVSPDLKSLYNTGSQNVLDRIQSGQKVDKVVYPLYINGNKLRQVDFEGRPWSRVPDNVEINNRYVVEEYTPNGGYDYSIPNKTREYLNKEDAVRDYDSMTGTHGTMENGIVNKQDPSTLENKNFDWHNGQQVRSVMEFASKPSFNKAILKEIRTPRTTNGLVQDSFRKDYDLVYMKDVIDSNGGINGESYAIDDLVTRYSNQMKLANAITYDDAGNVIPLSKRDNFNINDIRYGWLLPLGITLGAGAAANSQAYGGPINTFAGGSNKPNAADTTGGIAANLGVNLTQQQIEWNKKALGGHLFGDGGFSDLPEQRAYRRAVNLKVPYTNYEDAIDMDDSIMLRLKKFFDKGVSNCTLTASQLFNPNNPIGRARTIVNDSINNGFYEIDADHVVPGTMVIASHPNMSDYSPEQNYHTMVVTGFAPNDYEYTFRDGTKYQIKKGEPLVSYSRGKASADNYVHDIPLIVYNANSEGKTYNRYYRPIDENYPQVMIPEVTVVK